MIKLIIEDLGDKELINELNSLTRYEGLRRIPFEEIKLWEDVLKQFDSGTVIAMDTNGGYECFYKFSDKYGGEWKHACQHPPHISNITTFDAARNLCGSKWVTGNKDFYLDSLEQFQKIEDLIYHRDSNSGSNFSFIGPSDKRNFGQKKGFYGF